MYVRFPDSRGIYQLHNSHQDCCPCAYPLKLVIGIHGGFQVITLLMQNPDLHDYFYLYIRVQHQLKRSVIWEIGWDKPTHLSAPPHQQSLSCLSRDTSGVYLCFVQRSLTLPLIMLQRTTMQIIYVFSFCLPFYLITFDLKFITSLSQVWQIIPVCCFTRPQTPCLALGYVQLFARSNSINAETQENSGRHLPRGEDKRGAGFALECWSKKVLNHQHRNAQFHF